MKKLKVKLFFCLLFVFGSAVKAQNLETFKTYYDYARTQVKEVYTVKKGSGIRQGIYKLYDENRMLINETPYSNNLKNGVSKLYCSAGEASLEDKPMLVYGKIKHMISYKNDELDGSYKTYFYENGKQILRFDRIWSNGELVKDTEYYNNGKKKIFLQKNGVCNMWYETGEKLLEYTNVENVDIGLNTGWLKNGKINVLGNTNKNGNEEGVWKRWDENGNLTETVYENGIDVEKEKLQKEKELKVENERNEKIRKEQEADKLEREIELEKKRLKDEKEEKKNLINKKIENTDVKFTDVEKKYVVIDNFQSSVLDKDVYRTKKKNLYNAFIILRNDLINKIKNEVSLDEKILHVDTLEKLLDMMSNLFESDTKDLEKELKNVTELNKIKEIFKL